MRRRQANWEAQPAPTPLNVPDKVASFDPIFYLPFSFLFFLLVVLVPNKTRSTSIGFATTRAKCRACAKHAIFLRLAARPTRPFLIDTARRPACSRWTSQIPNCRKLLSSPDRFALLSISLPTAFSPKMSPKYFTPTTDYSKVHFLDDEMRN